MFQSQNPRRKGRERVRKKENERKKREKRGKGDKVRGERERKKKKGKKKRKKEMEKASRTNRKQHEEYGKFQCIRRAHPDSTVYAPLPVVHSVGNNQHHAALKTRECPSM
jgi:hypothetical protein